MAELDYDVVYRSGMLGSGLKVLVLDIQSADASDTVVVAEFDNAVKDTVCIQTDTGAEVDCTESGTTITIGSGPSDTPLKIMCSGY